MPDNNYSLATGGGTITINRRALQKHANMTADEVRAWAHSAGPAECLDRFDRTALVYRVERLLEEGGGVGSVGQFEIGAARGKPRITFEIRRVPA